MDIHSNSETHAGQKGGFTISGVSRVFLLQTLPCPSREAPDRQFRQRHVALNTNTALERGQRSRAEEITCDKLAMVSEVLGIWSGVILPFLFSVTGVFDEVYSLLK